MGTQLGRQGRLLLLSAERKHKNKRRNVEKGGKKDRFLLLPVRILVIYCHPCSHPADNFLTKNKMVTNSMDC